MVDKMESRAGVYRRVLAGGALVFLVAGCVTSSQTGSGRGSGGTDHQPVAALPPPAMAQRTMASGTIHLVGTPRQGVALRGLAPDGTRTLSFNGQPVPLTHGGAFLIAFDRDAPPTALLIARRDDGSEVRLPLSVAPGDWQIEQINASPTGSASTAEFRQLRAPELAEIEAARARMTPDASDGWRQQFVWPAVARISGRFGAQRIYRGSPGSYHTGVDIAAPAGSTYVAPADGVVILAADHPFTLEGNLLIVDHGMGLNSAFLHSARLLVKVGDVVRRGQPLGIVGATGRATGPHLHWGMKWNAARIDPVTLLAK